MTYEKIMSKTQDDAGCAVWSGCCSNGHPAMRHEGKTQLVRRVLWAAVHGEIPAGRVVVKTCETPKCVSLECMELTTHQVIAARNGATGLMSGPTRSAAIARAKRKTGKLTADAVREIRASTETGAMLAARFGVAQAHISKVRLHKVQRDFSNPWLQLGSRA